MMARYNYLTWRGVIVKKKFVSIATVAILLVSSSHSWSQDNNQVLIQDLKNLRQSVVNKMNTDISKTATAYADAKNIQNSLFFYDIARPLLDIAYGVWDAIKMMNIEIQRNPWSLTRNILQKAQIANSAMEIWSWYSTFNNCTQDGENLAFLWDGPSYDTAIKDMLTRAEDTSTFWQFNYTDYRDSISNDLKGLGNPQACPLRIPHKNADTRRSASGIFVGSEEAMTYMIQKIDDLVLYLQVAQVPADMVSNLSTYIKARKSELDQSRLKNVHIEYPVYVFNQAKQVDISLKARATLGSVAELENWRALVLGCFDRSANIEIQHTIKSVNKILFDEALETATSMANLSLSTTAVIAGQAPAIDVMRETFSLGLSLGDSVWGGNTQIDRRVTTKVRDQINMIPQQMSDMLSREFSYVVMLVDDSVNLVRFASEHGSPTISISSPKNSSEVNGTVIVTAEVTDVTKRVDFFVDDRLQYSDTIGPFSWVMNTQFHANGSHIITAKAYDIVGDVGVSLPVESTFNNSAGNNRPNIPIGLSQYKSDGSTSIGIGGSTAERTLVMKGTVSDPNSDSVAIDVEVKAIGTAFQDAPSAVCTSRSFVTSGSVAANTCVGLENGHYRWQARTRDSKGMVSAWLSAGGGNAESADDFVVAAGTGPVNQPPSVAVFSPNGGESLVAGSVQTVRWSASDDHGVQSVSIWYSTDGGVTISPIVSGLSNSGSYAWTVPGTLTNSGLIYVLATDGSLGSLDWSDAPFSVVQHCTLPSSPTLYDPGNYSETSNFTINWAASNAASCILQESTNPSFANFIPYTASGTSKYFAGKSNGFYYYRLIGVNACGQSPFSNVVDLEVRIPAPPAQATNPSPSNGQANVQRQGLNLSWSPGVGTSDVAIFLEKNNPDPEAHVGFGQITGSSYTLLETLDAGATYYWKIRAQASNGLVTDSPVWSFTTAYNYPDLIVDGLSLTGTVVPGGQVTMNLTVKNQGSFPSEGCRTNFYYSVTSGAKEQLLTSQGTLIPALQPGEQVTVHRSVTLTNLKSGQSFIDALIVTGIYFAEGDVSNNMRSLPIQYTDSSGPNITYLTLGLNSFFKTLNTYNIVFAAKDDTGIKNLDFSYSPDNGSTWQYIVQEYVPTGSAEYSSVYAWKIPAECPPTTNLLIKLTARDTSDNCTSLTAGPYVVKDGSVPAVSILSPNGGEVWGMGSTHDIRWILSAPNGVSNADLWFFYDDQAIHIADIRANTSGVYSWTLPSNLSTKTARVRIDVQDMNGNSSNDWSNGYFDVRDTSAPPPAPWNVPEVVDGTVMPAATAIAVDAADGVHVAYSRLSDEIVGLVRRVTSTIYYRKKTGTSWSAPQVVFNATQDIVSTPTNIPIAGQLRILASSAGLPHVVWVFGSNSIPYQNDSDIYYSRYDGSTWSLPRNLSDTLKGPSSGAISVSPDMTWDSAGNIHVAWTEGGYWEADVTQPLGYRWQGPNSLYHSILLTNQTWTAPAVASSLGRAPALASDLSGNVHMAYVDGLTTINHRIWNGSVWSEPQIVSNTMGGSSWEPDLSVDGGGVPRVVLHYWDDAQALSHVRYSESNSGTWSAPEDISLGGPDFEPSRPLLVTDAIGRPHVITEDHRGLPPALYYQYRGVSGWSNRVSLFYASQWPDSYTSSVAMSPARDHIHVVSGSNKGLIYNHAVIPSTLDIIAPVVTITAPAVGEVVTNGATYLITWVVADDSPIATVKIEYSSDGGNTYAVLATAAPNTGSYQWSVPSLEVAAAQLRITAVDPSGNASIATSGAFSIKDNKPPQVSLLSPSGGEKWDAGSQHNISWNTTDNTGVASVALYFSSDDGTSWQSISSGLAAIGTYGWSIPYVYSAAVRVKAVAYDAGGLSTEVASPALTIVRPNTPPVAPYSPFPTDNQADVALDATIQWSSGDLDGDALTYNVFFGTVSNPPKVATGVAGTSYAPPHLLEKTVYYWKIVASDGKASVAGPLWKITTVAKPINAPTSLAAAGKSATQINLSWNDNSDNEQGFTIERKIGLYGLYQVVASVGRNVTSFMDTMAIGNTSYIYRVRAYNAATNSGYSPEVSGTTMNAPPEQPSNPTPADRSSNQVLLTTLRWVGDDADFGDALTYDVYFGKSMRAPLISERQQDRQLFLGTLDPNSVYYWRVVAFDSYGDSAAGPWWTFVTGDQSPIISLHPAQLIFTAARGAGVAGPQELKIANAGGCIMHWELGTDTGWLKSSSLDGIGDGSVQITVETAGLATGTYQGILSIQAAGADNTPQVVPVTLNINDPNDPTLAAALDTALTVISGGDANWVRQTLTTHDGVDAAQSGTVADGQISWMQATATGTNVSFWWSASSDGGHDYLRFFIDGAEQAAISGEVAWEQKTFAMAAGSHTLKWEYSKDGTVSSGADRGWVDQLVVSTATLPAVTVTANDAIATEAGMTTGQYTVSRTGPTTSALTVYFTVGGTATVGSDYINIGTRVTIPAGAASAKITVTPINDTVAESDETVVVTLSGKAAYTVASPSSATVTITSDDVGQPTVQFSQAASSGFESTTPLVISATLSAASSQVVTVQYATTNGTAIAGSDYAATSGTLTFSPGVTSQSINITIMSDTAVEPNETFAVTLTAPSNATLGAISRHTRTISNDDFRGSIRLSSATYSVDEAGPTVTITATRIGGSSGAVGVRYATANGTATAGSDYTAASGVLNWANGDMVSKTFTVPITNDFLDEPNETFTVRILTTTGGAILGSPSSAIVTITDDDSTSTVQFSQVASFGAESTISAGINVTLSAASGKMVTVKYATANGTALSSSDYSARSGVLTFTPGSTSRTISVPIIDNTIVEPDENFTVTLTTPVNATLGTKNTHTYTINDEDVFGAIRLSSPLYLVSELGPMVTVTATRIGGSSGTVGISYATSNGTATAGSDYTSVSGTLSWANGNRASKTFTVPITNDILDEPNETFTVRLTLPTGGAILGSPSSATVTINDNEPTPTVRFSQAASSGAESNTPAAFNVTLSAESGKTVTVRYATANGTARSGSDYSETSGTLTFSPGVTSQPITVPILSDTEVELNETFAVTLTAPVNAVLATPYRHVYTITNDDFDFLAGLLSLQVNDFDGDGRSDYGIYDAAQGLWQLRQSTNGDLTDDLGSNGSVPVTGDFDGDGRCDYGVFDAGSGLWSLRQSTNGDLTDQLGSAGSVPVTGDFDGDGRCDYGVYDATQGIWQLRQSMDGDVTDQLGSAGMVPVTGDFDGDGRCDYGVFDPASGLWSLRLSTTGDVTVYLWSAGSVPVTGDFDGDGTSDYGCYSPMTGWWDIALSSGGLRTEMLGDAGAIPIVGDFDGDGKADLGSYSPVEGEWHVLKSTEGFWRTQFGFDEAIPIGGIFR